MIRHCYITFIDLIVDLKHKSIRIWATCMKEIWKQVTFTLGIIGNKHTLEVKHFFKFFEIIKCWIIKQHYCVILKYETFDSYVVIHIHLIVSSFLNCHIKHTFSVTQFNLFILGHLCKLTSYIGRKSHRNG